MFIGEQLRKLRQENNMTQADMGEALVLHRKQISAYERMVHISATEILIKIWEVFSVILDSLAFEANGQLAKLNIREKVLLRRFEVLARFSYKKKEMSNEILDLIILKHRFREIFGSRTTYFFLKYL